MYHPYRLSVLLLRWEGKGFFYKCKHRVLHIYTMKRTVFPVHVCTNFNVWNFIPLIRLNRLTRVRLVYSGISWKGPISLSLSLSVSHCTTFFVVLSKFLTLPKLGNNDLNFYFLPRYSVLYFNRRRSTLLGSPVGYSFTSGIRMLVSFD